MWLGCISHVQPGGLERFPWIPTATDAYPFGDQQSELETDGGPKVAQGVRVQTLLPATRRGPQAQ